MKNKSRNILFLLLVIFCFQAKGQQLPLFSQYILNGFILNPAMAGYDGYTSFNTTARQQWVGLEGAPQTLSATWQTRLLQRSYKIVNHPVRRSNLLLPSTKGRVGLGAYVINDRNAHVARTGVQFSYAYHIIMNKHQLSFGLAGKIYQFRIDDDELTYGDPNDPIITRGLQSVGYTPDADAGIYLTDTEYFIGVSASNLFQSAIKIGGASGSNNYRISRHYWFTGGYKFTPTLKFAIEPHFLFKTTETWIPQGDFGVRFYYLEDYWIGLAGRTDGSIISTVGFRADGLFIGYAFDFGLSNLQKFNFGTHEISVSYKLGSDARRYRWLRRY